MQAVVARLQTSLSSQNKSLKQQLAQVMSNLNYGTRVEDTVDIELSDLPLPPPLPAGTLSTRGAPDALRPSASS